MEDKVWLIGGTSESATIAQTFAVYNLPFVVTVTTITAQSLYSDAEVVVGSMDMARMESFCCDHKITAVVDASHPYAVEVSRQAIAITAKLGIPYLRYERANYQAATSAPLDSSLIELDSFDRLLTGDYLSKQRVLLTVGCQVLPRFTSWHGESTLFARILPKIASLETALAAGFTSDRLIAIRPPISAATETALWQQWKISLVVTKASGKAGGENVKRHVAANLGIPLIVITRPQIVYPQQTSALPEIIAFCRATVNQQPSTKPDLL